MAAKKNVSASTVRDWFNGLTEKAAEGIVAPGSRGRLHPDTIAAFHKANPRMRYETASEAEKPVVTVPVVTVDSAGRKRTEKRTVTTEQARAALGHPKGKRGRISRDVLGAALSALEAEKFAPSFK